MESYTLYQAQTFLIFLITLFGFNASNAKWKVYNRVVKAVAYILALVCLLFALRFGCFIPVDGIASGTSRILVFKKLYFGSFLACLILCHFRKRKFDALLKVLKRYKVSQNLSRKIRYWNIFLAAFAAPIYVIWLNGPRLNFYSLLDSIHEVISACVGTLLGHCLALCSLPVLLSIHYINHVLSEKMDEVKKCKSELRKARLTTRLILLSTRLNPLIKATNDYGAPLMFILKATGNILAVILIYQYFSTLTMDMLGTIIEEFAANVPPSLILCLYVWYLRVAPSANQIPSLMARVMMENVMSDEQRMSRDPISRIHLLNTRMVQLAHLTHSNFNQEQFTVLGEPANEADIFMVFVEIADNYNTYISKLW